MAYIKGYLGVIKLISLTFLIILLFSCNSKPVNSGSLTIENNELNINSLKSENQRLKEELYLVKNNQKEEQKALINFINLIDSINTMMNSIQNQYIEVSKNTELRNVDQKTQLLNKINNWQHNIVNDREKIRKLEARLLADRNIQQQNNKLVTLLRDKETEINELNTRIGELFVKIQEEEVEIKNRDRVIENNVKKIDELVNKLEEKHLIKISKNDLVSTVISGPTDLIYLPYRKGRIKILNDDYNFCKLNDNSSSGSVISVQKEFWDSTKNLVVFIRGNVNF